MFSRFYILLLLSFIPLVGNAARKALVIGNANYPPSKLFGKKPLSNPLNDAKDIAKRLAQYDFNVNMVLDANPDKMQTVINTFTSQLSLNDVALIYYSGHGIAATCDREVGQRNYLVPVGKTINDREDICRHAIAAESLIDKLTERGSGTNLLILDSCRNNLAVLELKGIENQGFTGMYGGSGTFIGYATAPGQVSIGNSERRNSLYTESLLAALQPPYDNQSIESLFQQVRSVVVQEANKLNYKQVPWDANGLEKSFCFRSPCSNISVLTEEKPPPSEPEPIDKPEAIDYVLPTMVRLPDGCFQMGSPEFELERNDNEPQHLVCLDAFYIGKYEVTNEEFRRFHPYHSSGQFEAHNLDAEQQPVVNITWQEATTYAEWLSDRTGKKFRLPTEAEWEYAARAETETAYWWGDEIDPQLCNFLDGDDGFVVTAPVGSYSENAWQLKDMHGNVSEWTCSAYSVNYPDIEQNCDKLYSGSNDIRVVRGGSWSNRPHKLRSAYRVGWDTSVPENTLGFRLVQDI